MKNLFKKIKKLFIKTEKEVIEEVKEVVEFIEYEETLFMKWGYSLIRTIFGPIVRKL